MNFPETSFFVICKTRRIAESLNNNIGYLCYRYDSENDVNDLCHLSLNPESYTQSLKCGNFYSITNCNTDKQDLVHQPLRPVAKYVINSGTITKITDEDKIKQLTPDFSDFSKSIKLICDYNEEKSQSIKTKFEPGLFSSISWIFDTKTEHAPAIHTIMVHIIDKADHLTSKSSDAFVFKAEGENTYFDIIQWNVNAKNKHIGHEVGNGEIVIFGNVSMTKLGQDETKRYFNIQEFSTLFYSICPQLKYVLTGNLGELDSIRWVWSGMAVHKRYICIPDIHIPEYDNYREAVDFSISKGRKSCFYISTNKITSHSTGTFCIKQKCKHCGRVSSLINNCGECGTIPDPQTFWFSGIINLSWLSVDGKKEEHQTIGITGPSIKLMFDYISKIRSIEDQEVISRYKFYENYNNDEVQLRNQSDVQQFIPLVVYFFDIISEHQTLQILFNITVSKNGKKKSYVSLKTIKKLSRKRSRENDSNIVNLPNKKFKSNNNDNIDNINNN